MLPQPPPSAEPTEGTPIAERVERCDGLGYDARFAKRDRGHQRAQPEVRVETREQAQGQPWLGYRLPSTVHLRNLDQVVHQRDATETECIGRQRHIPKPANRILCPRKPRDLQDDSRSCGHAMIMIGSGLLIDLGGGAILLDDHYLVPVLILGCLEERADLAQLVGEGRCRDWPVARSVALTADRGSSVHDHQHCRKSGRACEMPVGCPPLLIQPEGVDHRGQRALAPRGNDLIEQSEGVRGRLQVGRTAANRCPQCIGTHDLGRTESLGSPGGLSRTRRPGQDHHCGVRQPGIGHTPKSGSLLSTYDLRAARRRGAGWEQE